MSISPEGTFDYVAIVPESKDEATFECWSKLRAPDSQSSEKPGGARLLGHRPVMHVCDAGLTPNASERRPWVLRSCITLTAPSRTLASVESVSFHIDRTITANLRAGDVVHVARTACGGLALSVLRDDDLLVAVGAITDVPLGRGIQVRTPGDLIGEAERAFRRRDPEFRFKELPVEIVVGEHASILYSGKRKLDAYDVDVDHGFEIGLPGKDVCVAVSRRDVIPRVAAIASAMLLDHHDSLEMSRW